MSYAPHTAPVSAHDAGSASALPPCPRHPAGLLYTLLRHGRGLSHEEAARRCALVAASATLST